MTPIPKEGDNCDNYIPISFLPDFSKVFERVAYAQLCDYLENNLILHKQEYGFHAKKSTTQAILHFLQYLYKHIDSGDFVFSLFLYFGKAFDCVNREILLSKVSTCGVRGIALDWFHSYITNREQLLLLLLLKKVSSARLLESDIHPISPKSPAPQYQPIDRKKRKGKRVED